MHLWHPLATALRKLLRITYMENGPRLFLPTEEIFTNPIFSWGIRSALLRCEISAG